MAAYLAQITVRDVLEDDERVGMGDALGAHEDHEVTDGSTMFVVLGEAPDLPTASIAARRHAAEVLDGFTYEVDVVDLP